MSDQKPVDIVVRSLHTVVLLLNSERGAEAEALGVREIMGAIMTISP